MINGLLSRKMMFTFDKFAPSNIFHREFCSWNRNFVSYVDFILERRGIRKLDWIVRKGSAVFDRFSFAKTRRQDEWKNRWKFGYCVHSNVSLIHSSLFICIIDFTIRREIAAKDILIPGTRNAWLIRYFWQIYETIVKQGFISKLWNKSFSSFEHATR